MQYSSSLSPGVANFSSVEPIILVTALIVGVYTLRKLMTHYDNHRTEELDIYTRPLFPQVLVVFALLEAVSSKFKFWSGKFKSKINFLKIYYIDFWAGVWRVNEFCGVVGLRVYEEVWLSGRDFRVWCDQRAGNYVLKGD